MPKFLIPHRHGAHRIAAIALFRALLTQSKALQLPTAETTSIQNLIRNRFKGHRHVTSHRQLAVSFTAGYEAIDHLDAAVAGSEESKTYLLELLDKSHYSAKQTPPPPLWVQKQLKEKERKEKARIETESRPKVDIFARPLPLEKLSGKRRIPVLFSANRIPVLRFTKPQPPRLSSYITSRIKTRQKWQDRRMRLEAEIQLASEEDKWDAILSHTTGVDSRDEKKDPHWRKAVQNALDGVLELLENERRKNQEMAEKMQAVVDRETELARQEEEEERRKKKEEVTEAERKELEEVERIQRE